MWISTITHCKKSLISSINHDKISSFGQCVDISVVKKIADFQNQLLKCITKFVDSSLTKLWILATTHKKAVNVSLHSGKKKKRLILSVSCDERLKFFQSFIEIFCKICQFFFEKNRDISWLATIKIWNFVNRLQGKNLIISWLIA